MATVVEQGGDPGPGTAPPLTTTKPLPTFSSTTVGGGSGTSTSAFNQGIAVAREQIGLGKKTGLRNIAQALQGIENQFASGTRDLALGREQGTLRHEDVLRKIDEQRLGARTQLSSGLLKIRQDIAAREGDRDKGLRDITEFGEEETERVIDAAEARGLSRSGIQTEDVEGVAEDVQESTFDLNRSINELVTALEGSETDLRTTVKNLLTALEGDESAAHADFKLVLEGFENLESDLDRDTTLGKIDAAADKDELLQEVALALKALDARKAAGSGGGGLTAQQIFDGFIAAQNRLIGINNEVGADRAPAGITVLA